MTEEDFVKQQYIISTGSQTRHKIKFTLQLSDCNKHIINSDLLICNYCLYKLNLSQNRKNLIQYALLNLNT